MVRQYPSKKFLLQIADAAASLAKVLRHHWSIRGANASENPARTLFPKNVRPDSPVLRIHLAGMIDEVMAAHTVLKRLLAEVQPAEQYNDLDLALLGRNDRGAKKPDSKTVAGWPYSVSSAIEALVETRDTIGPTIGKGPVELDDVRALEAAAVVIRDAAGQPGKDGEAADDDSAFVPAVSLWKGKFDNYKAAKRFLDEHPEIRTHKPGKQRLKIHAGDWARHWGNLDNQGFDALDNAALPEITSVVVEGAKGRYKQHHAAKQRQQPQDNAPIDALVKRIQAGK